MSNVVYVTAEWLKKLEDELKHLKEVARVDVAEKLKAERLILLTDVVGVLDNKKKLITELNEKKATNFIKNGTIKGGMLPKIKTCFNIIKKGVKGVVIIDGRNPNATVLELFTKKGAGTLISK